ncbi:MAG TPA: glycosyltransferase family 39 protein [Ktedonobacteraceae bacterium]|nr:glycosyltransferase family 39 protein [Ktedonobacteraceae bacterium]
MLDEDTVKLESIVKAPITERNVESIERTNVTWRESLKQVWPIYLVVHVAFLLLTYFAPLFLLPNFSGKSLHISTFWLSWYRWDSGHFTNIATSGYQGLWQTAFFPLYPLLERGLATLVRDPFIAGLIISNLAVLGAFMILYRLVAEDFNKDRAWRTVLYLAVFPTAFFLVAAYDESLFLMFALFSFYQMRRGRWWLAGLASMAAILTRSSAIVLLVPFCYEYARQHNFQWRNIRLDVLSGLGIFVGLGSYSLYCYLRFHDPLAFSHAQVAGGWGRTLHGPWTVFARSLHILLHNPIISFISLHTAFDMLAVFFILALLTLGWFGPWKFSREHWSYAIYGCVICLFSLLFPDGGGYTTAGLSRYMIEVSPAFVILAGVIGAKRNWNMYYLALSLPLLAFLLLQWLTGGWVV